MDTVPGVLWIEPAPLAVSTFLSKLFHQKVVVTLFSASIGITGEQRDIHCKCWASLA